MNLYASNSGVLVLNDLASSKTGASNHSGNSFTSNILSSGSKYVPPHLRNRECISSGSTVNADAGQFKNPSEAQHSVSYSSSDPHERSGVQRSYNVGEANPSLQGGVTYRKGESRVRENVNTKASPSSRVDGANRMNSNASSMGDYERNALFDQNRRNPASAQQSYSRKNTMESHQSDFNAQPVRSYPSYPNESIQSRLVNGIDRAGPLKTSQDFGGSSASGSQKGEKWNRHEDPVVHRGGGAMQAHPNASGKIYKPHSGNTSYGNEAVQSNPNYVNQQHRQMMNNSVTGTLWDVRDGRRYHREDEADVFSTVKERTQTGINFDSYDNIPVDMAGQGAHEISPIDSFQSTRGVHELLMANVKRVGYERPTPVQKHSIPTILAGRDLMACAQTGSGKTAAFLFPIITKMLNEGPPITPAQPQTYGRRPPVYLICLVLSPTRELALQIYQESKKFQFGTGIRTVVLYGGSDVKSQLFDLDRGCDICVATPGRLLDLIERKKVKLSLLRYLVLDEADRMLDMGFAPQIRSIVEENDMMTSEDGRQTVMFSATFPREIQQLARDFLINYIHLAVGRVGSTNNFIKQRLQYADEDQKPKYLVKLLREQEQGLTLIFVETKKKADLIEDFLIAENFPAVSIHGDRSQHEREEALRLFKAGIRPVMVATDVAARGLDIPNITHVVNCDLPTNIEDYVHRIGRTGRAGNIGMATSFVNENYRPVLRDLLGILDESNQEIPSWFQDLVMSCTSSGSRMGSSCRFGARGGRSNTTGYNRMAFASRDIRSTGELDRVSFNHTRGGPSRIGDARGGKDDGDNWRNAAMADRNDHSRGFVGFGEDKPKGFNDAW